MTSFTKLIKEKRSSKGDTFEKMARALKCSPAFAKHIIYSDIVPVSPRLVDLLSKRYGIPKKRLILMAEKRNKIGREYYRKYKAKRRVA